MPAPPSPERRTGPVRTALLACTAVYGGYALLGVVGLPPDVRSLGLIAAFYFLPGWLLRRDPERQLRYQVGPDGPVPPWSRRGLKVAAIAALAVFPPFVLGFLWFYGRTCPGDLSLVAPVLWLEDGTPLSGGLEAFLSHLCRGHNGEMWPDGLRVPARWAQWGGLGGLYAVVYGVFAVALPEEIFHRGYLMSAFEERWPPRRRILGVPFGVGAVASSLVFALGHLVAMLQVGRLATFFPSLVFAWLWRKSGSLWAPALFHTASNLLMDVLIASTFPA